MSTRSKAVAIIVLAAGSSKRMGMRKQTLEILGEPMLRRAVRTALNSKAASVFVTVPPEAPEVSVLLEGFAARPVTVSQPELGQSESIRAGLAEVEMGDYNAILFMPCDLPLLTAQHLDALIETYLSGEIQIVASRYDDVLGIPLLLDRSLWEELKSLRGDVGARKIINAHSKSTLSIDWDGGRFDLDTIEEAEDYLNSL